MSPSEDDQMRRWFWVQQMELAVLFMERVLTWPVEECGERLVHLPTAAAEAGVEVTFSDRPHALGLPRLYYLREGQINGFISAAREFNRIGWVMKVEDGFRSRQMQKYVGRQQFVFDAILKTCVWELGGKTPAPDLMLRRLTALTASCAKVGTHMSGSAIDISLWDRSTKEEVSRERPYLDMSEMTPMLSPFVSPPALASRMRQVAVMRTHGFIEYPYEFWHFNSGDAYDHILTGRQAPARYGPVDFDEGTGKITPIENPQEPLNSLEEIRGEIEAAINRLT